jgi:hypothetical protein
MGFFSNLPGDSRRCGLSWRKIAQTLVEDGMSIDMSALDSCGLLNHGQAGSNPVAREKPGLRQVRPRKGSFRFKKGGHLELINTQTGGFSNCFCIDVVVYSI